MVNQANPISPDHGDGGGGQASGTGEEYSDQMGENDDEKRVQLSNPDDSGLIEGSNPNRCLTRRGL